MSSSKFSFEDATDPLNAPIPPQVYVNTKEICAEVAHEIKSHLITQEVFAEKILGRSQGTLSILLKDPKPWGELKTEMNGFRRMYNWTKLPEKERLAMFEGVRVQKKRKATEDPNIVKRSRFAFTEDHKQILLGHFEQNDRPSEEMLQTIAEELQCGVGTVWNFFKNERARRNREGKKFVKIEKQDEETFNALFQQTEELSQEQENALLQHFDQENLPSLDSMKTIAQNLQLEFKTVEVFCADAYLRQMTERLQEMDRQFTEKRPEERVQWEDSDCIILDD